MAVPSPPGEVKIVSPVSILDTQIKCFFFTLRYICHSRTTRETVLEAGNVSAAKLSSIAARSEDSRQLYSQPARNNPTFDVRLEIHQFTIIY